MSTFEIFFRLFFSFLYYLPSLLIYGSIFVFINGIGKSFLDRRKSAIISIVFLSFIAFVVPYVVNFGYVQKFYEISAQDKTASVPIVLPETVALLGFVSPGHPNELGFCTELCQRLLYNGAVKRVIIWERPIDLRGRALGDAEFPVFYILKQKDCPELPLPPTGEAWGSAREQIVFRVTAGECLLEGKARLSEAMFVLNYEEGKGPFLFEIRTDRLTAAVVTPQGIDVIDRKTHVRANILSYPLIYAATVGWSGGVPTGLRWGFGSRIIDNDVNLTLFQEYKRLFGEAVRLPAEPKDITRAELFRRSLDNGKGEELFNPFVWPLVKSKKVTDEDIKLISRAIKELHHKNFASLDRLVKAIKDDAAPLAKPMAQRLLNANLSKEKGMGNLARAIAELPSTAVQKISSELDALARRADYGDNVFAPIRGLQRRKEKE